MNVEEAGVVLRKVQAYRPAQTVDQLVIAAWQEALDDIRFEDALLAVRNIGRASDRYIEPAKVRDEVARLLADRKNHARESKCYICGGTWEQCAKRHAYEVRNGVPDPHDWESAETAERNAVPMPPEIRQQIATLLDKKNLAKGGV
ncbi:MAG TPA: hypothetical protein VJW23_20595 [Propionibacteriaceae bacterium]|nr:hypothetical protein [Propionibacteriaceae bacterium]